MSRVRLFPLRPDLAQLKVHAGSESARHPPKPQRRLNGTEDIALPPGEWGWHPRMSRRLGPYRLVQLPGTHEVIFSDPNGLADKIIEAGRDQGNISRGLMDTLEPIQDTNSARESSSPPRAGCMR